MNSDKIVGWINPLNIILPSTLVLLYIGLLSILDFSRIEPKDIQLYLVLSMPTIMGVALPIWILYTIKSITIQGDSIIAFYPFRFSKKHFQLRKLKCVKKGYSHGYGITFRQVELFFEENTKLKFTSGATLNYTKIVTYIDGVVRNR